MTRDIAASVRQKLRNLARDRHEEFDYVLRQYVMQRLLYRLSRSEYVDQFLLKGALLFWVWNGNFLEPVYQSIAEQKSFTQKWLSDKFQWK